VGLVRALAPYVLLAAILALTRIRALPLGGWLAEVRVGVKDILGTGIGAALQPLYSPGGVFVVVALLAALLFRLPARGLGAAAADSLRVVARTAVPLLGAVATVRVFIHSGVNTAGLEAMPLVLAEAGARGVGEIWPLVAPWVGALGSFVSGSATFSNMLFALFQHGVAAGVEVDAVTVLALQGIGAAAGNMVCVHNVVAACAVAGILGREGEVIRRTAPPMAVYVLLAGLLGAFTLM
jgi:lactate permease